MTAPGMPTEKLTGEQLENLKEQTTEVNLTAALKAQMAKDAASGKQAAKGSVTEDEAKKFETAFKDPEFRKLMSEYVAEISDPANRAEQDAYIKQLEDKDEVPDDKEVVRVTKGFAVKFKVSNSFSSGFHSWCVIHCL